MILAQDKEGMFWDGFLWIPKTNYLSLEEKEKKMQLTVKLRKL
jgi:hypothetical protein